MSFLWFVIMIIAAGGMVFGLAKDKQGAQWGKPLTIACAIVALLLAVGTIFSGGNRVDVEAIRERELAYAEISTHKLGAYLGEKFAGSDAVVIVPIDFGVPNESAVAQLRGLKEGLGTDVEIVAEVSPELSEEFKQMMEQAPEGAEMPYMGMAPMMDMMIRAEQFNKIFKEEAKGVDLVITLVGLPMDLENLICWKMSDPPKLAVYSAMQVPRLKEAIKQDYVSALIAYRPDPDMEQKDIPDDMEEAFAKRYLLITPENVEEYAAKYEMLFPEY